MRKITKVVKTVGQSVAKGAVNSSSFALVYQPKEPKNLAERLAKMSK